MPARETTPHTPRRTAAIALAGLAGLAALSGCANRVTLAELRMAPAPNFVTVGETYTEALNDVALKINMDRRLIADDARRAWLMDKSSILSKGLTIR